MRLIAFKARPGHPGESLRRYRWSLHIEPWSIDLKEELLWSDGEWAPIHRYIGVYVSALWLWGFQHIFYDGPNCSLNIGPVQFGWSLGHCGKCCPATACAVQERKGEVEP